MFLRWQRFLATSPQSRDPRKRNRQTRQTLQRCGLQNWGKFQQVLHGKPSALIFRYHDGLFLQGFLTKSGLVNPSRVQMIMQELGKMEDAIFKERQSRELRFKAMNKAKRRRDNLESEQGPAWMPRGQFAPHVSSTVCSCRIISKLT